MKQEPVPVFPCPGVPGFMELRMSESILHDCARINKILITITAKVRKCISGGKE